MTTSPANVAIAPTLSGYEWDMDRYQDLTPEMTQGAGLAKLNLATSSQARALRVGGSWVSLVDARSAKMPIYHVRDATVPFGVDKFGKLLFPADPDTAFGAYVKRIDALVRKAAHANAKAWFGMEPAVLAANDDILEVHTGLRTSPKGYTNLSVKAMDGAEYRGRDGTVLRGAPELARHTVDAWVSIDGLFVRGTQLYVRWRYHAVLDKGVAAPRLPSLTNRLAAFTLLEEE